MCREVSKDTMASGNLKHMILWNRWKFLLKLLLPTLVPMNSDEEYEQQFEQLSDDQKLSRLCSNAGLKNCRKRTIFHHT